MCLRTWVVVYMVFFPVYVNTRWLVITIILHAALLSVLLLSKCWLLNFKTDTNYIITIINIKVATKIVHREYIQNMYFNIERKSWKANGIKEINYWTWHNDSLFTDTVLLWVNYYDYWGKYLCINKNDTRTGSYFSYRKERKWLSLCLAFLDFVCVLSEVQ